MCALIGALGFSGKAIFAKLAYAAAPIDAVTVLALRMLFSMPFIGAMIWWSRRDARQVPLTRRDWIIILWLGFIGYYLASLLDFWGLEYISAGLERLILFTNPTIVVVMSALLLGKKISRRTAVALLLTYAGIILVFAHDLLVSANTTALLVGSGLVLGSAVAYAIYLVGNGQIIGRIGPTRFTAYGMAVSAVFIFVQFALTRSPSVLQQPASVYWTIAGMALFSTLLPIWLTNEGIRRIGAGPVAMIGTSGPVMTIGLGALFLGEPITLFQIAGAALVIAGVAVVTFARRR
ncbi:MAG: DMT family transporter [Casimicrobiaceae bacterium]